MGGLIVCFGLVVWLFGFIADLVFTTYWLHLVDCMRWLDINSVGLVFLFLFSCSWFVDAW